eukprot:TRINITY_DN18270_c0_g1_i1.p1 TRINITY_DN18270_c0_g1~~TRINITY_DN18270_c0_g1_i1.p1  ORF type:complete len:363 (+),score=160.90 TRINITY_DN18270_c0_g1_i1:90-1178(+)
MEVRSSQQTTATRKKYMMLGLMLCMQALGVFYLVLPPTAIEKRHKLVLGGEASRPVVAARKAAASETDENDDEGDVPEFVRDVELSLYRPGQADMPTVGLGTAALGAKVEAVVLAGLEMGYRHIDTAMAREWYRDDLVGSALAKSGINRHKVFITSKIHPRDLGTEPTRQKLKEALANLKTSYINLFLLHYPECYNMCKTPPQGTWKDSWRVLEEGVRNGTLQYIGVSNFGVRELEELWDFAKVKPYAVQVHSDPIDPNTRIQEFCKEKGIKFVAYSSLGTQHAMRSEEHLNPVLTSKVVLDIAKKRKIASPALVVLRWAIHHGQRVIPRTANLTHMRQNLDCDRIHLDSSDYSEIDNMKRK